MIKKLIKIFAIFFKMGASTFGGGYAMIPIIEKEIVENNNYITKDEFIDNLSIAQSFPGPMAVNLSLLIGYKLYGIIGSIATLLGVVMPSFLSIILIAFFYNKFNSSTIVKGFFNGVNAVVPALLLISFISVFKKLPKKIILMLLFIMTFIAIAIFNINPLIAIFIGGVLGICLKS